MIFDESRRHRSLRCCDCSNERKLDGFWLHLDVDVLDAEIMPAVDSPDPNGLTWDEFDRLLRVLLGSSRITGMEVTIFDPDLDSDGSLAASLVDHLRKAFSRRP